MLKLLNGIKVLDLTRLLPGPHCTLYLAELGAEVIKVEPPEGDYIIHLAPQLYRQLNYPKKCVKLDLKNPGDKKTFFEMVKDAQVVVESFRPGVVQGLTIDFESLKAINPSLVYCSISGYGQTGPYRNYPGHDMNYLATAGVLEQMNGLANFQIADIAGGSLSACVGILAALIDSQKTKRPHYVDISMTDCSMALNQVALATGQAAGKDIPRGEDLLSGGFPFYNLYETQDQRRIALGALEAKFWKNFCEAIGKIDWVQWHSGPREKYPEFKQEIGKLFKTKTMREWEKLLSDKECCFSPVLKMSEALEDPQSKDRQMVQDNGFKKFKFPLVIDP